MKYGEVNLKRNIKIEKKHDMLNVLKVALMRVVFLCIVLFGVCVVFSSVIFLYADNAVDAAEKNPGASVSKSDDIMPNIAADAAVLYCRNTRKKIFVKNENKRLNPYSITKLMTAYLAIKNLDMESSVTVRNIKLYDNESTMGLKNGEKLKVRELLYGLLILSGNDAAVSLAKEVSGSEYKFVELMNDTATKWGCTSTHFANPSGIKSSDHYTTASDFLIIAKKTLSDPVIKSIAGTKEYVMPPTNKSEERIMKTHIDMLNDADSGVKAGKTGYWEDGDCSIATLYEKNDMELILILLHDKKGKRRSDAKSLYKFAQKTVKGFRKIKRGKPLGRAWIKGGKYTYVDVYTDNNLYIYPASGREESIDININVDENLKMPLKKGDTVGTAEITDSGRSYAKIPIKVNKYIARGLPPSELYISDRAVIVIVTAVLVAIVFIYIFHRKNRRQFSEYQPKH